MGLHSEGQVLRNLARRIKALRAERAWSQDVLAEKSHLHRTYIAGIEAGHRNPSLRSLIKIANAFRVPVVDLLDGR